MQESSLHLMAVNIQIFVLIRVENWILLTDLDNHAHTN